MLFYRFASFWLYCGEWKPLLIFIYHRDALRRLCWVDGCILIHPRYDLFQSVPTLWFGPEQSWTSQHGPCTRVLLWLLLRAHCQSSARVKVGRLCVRVYCKKTSFSPLREGPALGPPSVQRALKLKRTCGWSVYVSDACHIVGFHGCKRRFSCSRTAANERTPLNNNNKVRALVICLKALGSRQPQLVNSSIGDLSESQVGQRKVESELYAKVNWISPRNWLR